MRRIRRHGFTLLAATALLLCLIFTTFWLRSHQTSDRFFLIYRGEGFERLVTWHGDVIIHHNNPHQGATRDGLQRVSHTSVRLDSLPPGDIHPAGFPVHWQHLGFRFDAVTQADLQKAQTPGPIVAPFSASPPWLSRSETRAGPSPQEARQIQQRMMIQMLAARQTLRDIPTAQWRLSVPLWVLAVATSILPLTWLLLRVRSQRRVGRGLCRVCGYDLRASSLRCPECGTPIDSPTVSRSSADV
jgi:hypothetical protein